MKKSLLFSLIAVIISMSACYRPQATGPFVPSGSGPVVTSKIGINWVTTAPSNSMHWHLRVPIQYAYLDTKTNTYIYVQISDAKCTDGNTDTKCRKGVIQYQASPGYYEISYKINQLSTGRYETDQYGNRVFVPDFEVVITDGNWSVI